MSKTSQRINERALQIIYEAVALLDKDMGKIEKQVNELRNNRDSLKLVRDHGLSELTAEQAMELGRALLIFARFRQKQGNPPPAQ